MRKILFRRNPGQFVQRPGHQSTSYFLQTFAVAVQVQPSRDELHL